ncbi:ATP-grasp domain-containing protein [soil metagenome]
MRILLTGAGGAAAISVWKSLGSEHELYMADIDPCATGLYLVPHNQRILLSKGDALEFVDTVVEICNKYKIDLLIPTVDVELEPLAIAAERFLAIGVKIALSSAKVLQLCRDKYALLTFCQEHIPVPEFNLLNPDNISAFKTFPLFAKPRRGAGSTGALLIKKSQDLVALPKDESYLIQEFLPGEEYSVDVYIDANGSAIAAVPRLRMKIDSGVAVAARTVQLTNLVAIAVETAKHVGIRYVANVQFKRAVDGQFKLLEINPRFPGTLPLTAAAGVDIPQLLMKEILGQNLPQGLMPYKELMVVRYWAEHFCAPSEWEALCQY